MKKRVKKIAADKPIVAIKPILFSMLLEYMFSEFANRNFVTKLRLFFESVNVKHYQEDGDLEIYYRIITRVIDFYLDDNITNPELLLEKIVSSNSDGDEINDFIEEFIDSLEDKEAMDLKSSVFLENEFIDRLNFININPLTEKMQLTLSKLANNDFINYHSIIQEVNSISAKINKSVLSNSVVSVTLPDITFQNNDDFKTSIGRARRYLNNDKRVIKTGIKRLNRFLNGGFEPGRVYTINGISGGGKSVILLLIAIWALKYNKDIVCNDMIRKPCLIYYTQENDVEETLDRIFSYIEGRDEKGKIRDENDLFELLTEHGILDGRWVLKIKYRPKNTISTMDIDNDISEIEAEGDLEVKMIVHDYLKRFKPDNPVGDIRVDMGEAN